MKPILKLLRFDNLLFLIILVGVMEKWVLRPVMAHYQLPEPLMWWQLVMLIAAVVLIAAGGYVINDYFDVKIDRINRPDDLVITRDVSKQTAMYIFYGLTGAGIACGLALSFVLRSMSLLTVFVLTPGILWFYSASYKRQFMVGNLVVAAMAALVPLTVGIAADAAIKLQYGADSMQAQYLVNLCYIWMLGFGIFAFLCTWMREVIKDIEDQEGDRELECHTWPVKYGDRASKIFVTVLCALTVGLLSWITFAWFPAHLGLSFSWGNLASRFYLFLVVGFVCDLSLLWAAKLPSDYHNAQVLMKFIMFIGMMFAICVGRIL